MNDEVYIYREICQTVKFVDLKIFYGAVDAWFGDLLISLCGA